MCIRDRGTGSGIKFPLLLVNEGENILNKVLDFLMKIVFLVCACISIAAVITICLFMFANGVPAIKEIGITKFLFGTQWRVSQNLFGIWPMIVGSIDVYKRQEQCNLYAMYKGY